MSKTQIKTVFQQQARRNSFHLGWNNKVDSEEDLCKNEYRLTISESPTKSSFESEKFDTMQESIYGPQKKVKKILYNPVFSKRDNRKMQAS